MPNASRLLGTIGGGENAVKTTVQLYARLTGDNKPWDFGQHDLDKVPQVGHEIVLTSGGRIIKVRVTSVYRRILDEHGNTGIPNVYVDEI
jgi:hypothetical protein